MRISDWSSDVCSSDLHAGDHFETTLVVDKYLSEHCGWRFRTANAIVARRDGRGQDGSSTNVLDGSRYEVDDSVPRCNRRNKACTEDRFWRLSNHDDSIPRSKERRVGNECVSTCRVRLSPHN